jgi:hypothetical protein
MKRRTAAYGCTGRCCTEPNGGMWIPASPSSNANRNGLGDPDHAIEHPHPKRNLTLLVRNVRARSRGPSRAL